MLKHYFVAATVASALALGSTYTAAAFSATMPSTTSMNAGKERLAISQACSAKATAQNLHGKQRKAFRKLCIKNGG